MSLSIRSCDRDILVRASLIALVAIGLAATGPARAQGPEGYIGGKVTGAQGPEAGVWVIAETEDLAARFWRL